MHILLLCFFNHFTTVSEVTAGGQSDRYFVRVRAQINEKSTENREFDFLILISGKIHEKNKLCFLSRNGVVVRFRIQKKAKGSTNTRGQRPRRAMARVLPGAPRLAADCFGRQRLGGYGSRRFSDGLAPPRHPKRASATGIWLSNV